MTKIARAHGFNVVRSFFIKNEESLISLKIYDIVRNIPRGEVMTYGQIAEMLGE